MEGRLSFRPVRRKFSDLKESEFGKRGKMNGLKIREAMAASPKRTPISAIILFFVMLSSFLAWPGCGHFSGFLGLWQRQQDLKKEFHEEPSAGLLADLQPEDCYLLWGRVVLNRDPKGPLLVVAVTDKFRKREIVASRILDAPAEDYQVYLPEGRYDLYFFADLDRNGYFDAHEMVGQTSGEPIEVSKADVKDGMTVNGPSFKLDLNGPTKTELPIQIKVREQANVFASLDHDFFDPKYGLKGLYDPKSLIAHTQRFFFSLEKFDRDKTLVLFVHGIGGTPRDFKYLVDGLDKTLYQPWFYFYPSGMPLQKLGSLLGETFKRINKTQRYRHDRIIVVAHSIGGLVALSGLNQLCTDGAPPYLKGYISFNSPYGGVEAAKMAGKMPVVVPSWADIAAGSPFLERLYQGNAPRDIPFYLFFGYKTGDSSDGTIALQSQLEPKIHLTAFKSYGFHATHVGILNDEESRKVFNQVLKQINTK
jgi:pimeloyl-ACP methyl ester carboxylesterase